VTEAFGRALRTSSLIGPEVGDTLAIESAKWAAPRRASAPGPLAHTPAPTGRFTRGFAAGEGMGKVLPYH